MKTLVKGDKKLLNAWAFYDWANSVYNLVITSAVFPIFYMALFDKNNPYATIFGTQIKSSALISFVTAAAFLIVAFVSPILSGIADFVGNKKSFMRFFCYLGSFSCIGLYWFSLEHIYISLSLYLLALVGYWGSVVFYNSYLPDIAFPEQQDKLSAKGYSLGYFGSVILLIINLIMIMTAPDQEKIMQMKYSFIMVGIWWFVFSQYSFYYLPNGVQNETKKSSGNFIFNGFTELKKVWNSLDENPKLKAYLRSFFVYSMAVQTVMIIATYFGEEAIAWTSKAESTKGLISCILLIQLVAIIGAYLTSKVSEKYGNIPTLITINSFWAALCLFSFSIKTPLHFYIMATLVGLVMGAVQSLSRSTYSKLLPETKDTASFFSFFDVAEKIGIVIGMCFYGIIDQVTKSPRIAMISLTAFFVTGVILLKKADKKN